MFIEKWSFNTEEFQWSWPTFLLCEVRGFAHLNILTHINPTACCRLKRNSVSSKKIKIIGNSETM